MTAIKWMNLHKNKYLLMKTVIVWMRAKKNVWYPVPKKHLNDKRWNIDLWRCESIKLIETQLHEISTYTFLV